MGNRKKEQDNYTLYQKRIYNENRILIHYASFLSVTVNTLAFLLSFFSEIMRSSRLIYALGAILSVVCVLLFRFFEEKQAGTSAGWFYGFWSGILLETAVLGTLMQPHGNAVTFCVTLITLGALLLDRPGRIFILMASASILCCLFSFLFHCKIRYIVVQVFSVIRKNKGISYPPVSDIHSKYRINHAMAY